MEQKKVHWENRNQFFAFADQLMRRNLIDYARAKKTMKRGAGISSCSPSPALWIGDVGAALDSETLLSVHEALIGLEATDPPAAKIVELRFFAGLTIAETAKALAFRSYRQTGLADGQGVSRQRTGGDRTKAAHPRLIRPEPVSSPFSPL